MYWSYPSLECYIQWVDTNDTAAAANAASFAQTLPRGCLVPDQFETQAPDANHEPNNQQGEKDVDRSEVPV